MRLLEEKESLRLLTRCYEKMEQRTSGLTGNTALGNKAVFQILQHAAGRAQGALWHDVARDRALQR